MPYTKDHKRRTRERILESAQRLFASKGFEETSIEDIMVECKLTRGGFYAHFRSKGQLYQEAMANNMRWHPLTGPTTDAMSTRWLDTLLDSCLHGFDSNKSNKSLWAFLATDVVSKQPEVRAAYAQVFKTMAQRLYQEMGRPSDKNKASLAAMAMAVGALAVAMTVDDAALKASLVQACREHAKELFGNTSKEDPIHFFWMTDMSDSNQGTHVLSAMH